MNNIKRYTEEKSLKMNNIKRYTEEKIFKNE